MSSFVKLITVTTLATSQAFSMFSTPEQVNHFSRYEDGSIHMFGEEQRGGRRLTADTALTAVPAVPTGTPALKGTPMLKTPMLKAIIDSEVRNTQFTVHGSEFVTPKLVVGPSATAALGVLASDFNPCRHYTTTERCNAAHTTSDTSTGPGNRGIVDCFSKNLGSCAGGSNNACTSITASVNVIETSCTGTNDNTGKKCAWTELYTCAAVTGDGTTGKNAVAGTCISTQIVESCAKSTGATWANVNVGRCTPVSTLATCRGLSNPADQAACSVQSHGTCAGGTDSTCTSKPVGIETACTGTLDNANVACAWTRTIECKYSATTCTPATTLATCNTVSNPANQAACSAQSFGACTGHANCLAVPAGIESTCTGTSYSGTPCTWTENNACTISPAVVAATCTLIAGGNGCASTYKQGQSPAGGVSTVKSGDSTNCLLSKPGTLKSPDGSPDTTNCETAIISKLLASDGVTCFWAAAGFAAGEECRPVRGGELQVDNRVISRGFEFVAAAKTDDTNDFGTNAKLQINAAVKPSTIIPFLKAGTGITFTAENSGEAYEKLIISKVAGSDNWDNEMALLCNMLGVNYAELKTLANHKGLTEALILSTKLSSTDIAINDPTYVSEVVITDACSGASGAVVTQTCRCGNTVPGGNTYCLYRGVGAGKGGQKCTITGTTGVCSVDGNGDPLYF